MLLIMEKKELSKKEYNILDVASKIGSLLIPILIFYFGYRIQKQQAQENDSQCPESIPVKRDFDHNLFVFTSDFMH